jgi:putative FmdB family regulatory protein
MPTYEYLCQTCSHRFETWQKMTDEPLTTCPECGAHIRRVLFPAGVVFKGSGFYKTDYSKNGAVLAGTNDESKKTENTDSNGNASNGETKTGDSKTTSEISTGKSADKTATSANKTNGSNGSGSTHTGESKSTTPATK